MGLDDTRESTVHDRLLGERYRLGALLGRGGAGRVYEAVDVTLGRTVAVKLYQAGGNAGGRYRFAAEARLLAGLSHPRLVTVYDVGLDGDEPFLVMRLVNGPTLRDLLDRGPFDPPAVARIGAQLADVLAYLHTHDVVHRDIKPSNVLVDASGACHLTDFGLARALSAAHLTVSGEFVGTAAYVAPEQITDVDTGPPADIYALGLLLLECLTGHTEYTGTAIETALARLTRPPRVPDTLPAPWQALLSTMTAQDPENRPNAAQCAEVLDAITEGRSDAAAPPPAEPPPVTTKLGRFRRRPHSRAVPAGLTALALTAAAWAVAASPTTAVPGRPHNQPTPNTTETIADAVPPPLSTTTDTSRTPSPSDDPTTTDPPGTTTTPPTTPTTTSKTNNGNGNGNEGTSKTNGKKNGQN